MGREMQLVVPAISISILVYFVCDVIKESVGKILQPDDDELVNPYIILGFAIFGIIFDVICLIAFARNQNEEGQGVNMLAAFMHVAADFARSIATLIAAIMIMYFGFDGHNGRVGRYHCMRHDIVGCMLCCRGIDQGRIVFFS